MATSLDIQVLYEDEHVVAVNKPAGLVVHPDGKTIEPALTDWILEKYPHIKEVGEPSRSLEGETIYRPGIVHRLDRDTSGVLLVAKDQETFQHLKRQFQESETKKIYNVFVYGEIKEKEGIIDRPIARSRKDFRMWSAQRGGRGLARKAITEYSVIAENKGLSFVEARPKTGRTHQIRAHFKAINHPVVCDSLYAPKRESVLGFTRLALHSRSIEFTELNGSRRVVEAPLPADFVQALASFKA